MKYLVCETDQLNTDEKKPCYAKSISFKDCAMEILQKIMFKPMF